MKDIPGKLSKPYDPAVEEKRLYEKWEASGYFNPEKMIAEGFTASDAKPFSIILPPPNVTGNLHMGHAMMLTVQDILIRYHRMKGDRTLWIPGTDHAAIATQSKVEKEIQKKEGKSRYDLGREELLKRIETFAQESHDTIIAQTKTMGASLDWSREAFTLDAPRTTAVRTAFKKMYDDGLIYRGNRIVNWDPKGQTTISDDEIVYESRKSKLYTFKYSKDFPISISTTRPETKVGDVAVAVHPDDARYSEFVGKEYDVNFCGVDIHIKIVADESVEKEFGTGALGVTPAHALVDWDIADRHGLPRSQVINEHAKMMVGDARLLGKKVGEAREIVVEWLRSQGLLEKEEDIDQNVATAERTGGIIEPLPKLQWFINVTKPIPARGNKTLKELMRESVATDGTSGAISIIPEYFSKTYFHWIDNLRDWCISRQIWYGHRIPVWYKHDETYCGIEAPEGDDWTQDEDTLDTWFSSGLWTFSTLGWPEQTEDLKIYHPTTVLETGYDILFFWVARMILMSQYFLGEIPFTQVYLHGLVRDQKGEKMSKSLGNAMDPIDIAQKYGADAGRMALIFGTAPGTDSKISEDKIKGMKHFANKLWNIARFVLENIEITSIGFKDHDTFDPKDESVIRDLGLLYGSEIDVAIQKEKGEVVKKVTDNLEKNMIHEAALTIYNSIWHEFADVYIEHCKNILKNGNEDEKRIKQTILYFSLQKYLKLLHPFMPFVTEAIWELLPQKECAILMVTPWDTH